MRLAALSTKFPEIEASNSQHDDLISAHIKEKAFCSKKVLDQNLKSDTVSRNKISIIILIYTLPPFSYPWSLGSCLMCREGDG